MIKRLGTFCYGFLRRGSFYRGIVYSVFWELKVQVCTYISWKAVRLLTKAPEIELPWMLRHSIGRIIKRDVA